MSEHIASIVTRDELKTLSNAEVLAIAAEARGLTVAEYRTAMDVEHRGDFRLDSYTPPGPVTQAFILDNTRTASIMGPLGGGKTTACVFKRIYAATLAPVARHPGDARPTRMCRWIVLRDTFRSAEKTVLESWQQWFPKGYAGSTWTGGNDRPVTHILRFIGQDSIRIEAVTEFAGLGEMSIETLMKGREYSGAWLNEIDTHAEGSLDDMEQRVGRYPMPDLLLDDAELAALGQRLGRAIEKLPRRKSVIGDMNAPTIDNWTYPTFVTERGPDRAFFQQPSGRSPEAENLFNLEPDYYELLVRNQAEHFVRRMVDNKFGYSRAGKAVHEGFDHVRHVSEYPIEFDPNLDLLIGIDCSTNALSPAAVFGQVKSPGRIALIDEHAPDHGTGAARFGEGLKRILEERYATRRALKVWIDPASQFGGDKEGGQLAAQEILQVILGVPIVPAFGGANEIGMRLNAVDAELRGYLEPNSHLIVSPNCKLVIAGFAGQYRYKRRTETASNEYEDAPEKKHPVSDVMDGVQYLIGGVRGRNAAIRSAGDDEASLKKLKSARSAGWGKARPAGGFDVHRI